MDSAAHFGYNHAAVKKKKAVVATLRQALSYEPVELIFGTSGLRGLVRDMTSLEAYVNTRGFLAWLREAGEAVPGGTVFVAGDLRPSTDSIVLDEGSRGELLQAVCRAVGDSGMTAVSLGRVPTPALVSYALSRKAPSVMVTGSHIPADRNGIKFNRPSGETLKTDEAPILAAVKRVREEEYARPFDASIFDARGMIRDEHRASLPDAVGDGAQEYARRYTASFPHGALSGRKVIVWLHSSVGGDILDGILRELGAQTIPAGRSSGFIAVDTEAIDAPILQTLQSLVDANGGASIDAVVSTDGDSDRPLVAAVDRGRVRVVHGDLLGLIASMYLGARHVAVPINASDAVERGLRDRGITVARTRIGSPYVVAAMREMGWESNGGFLTSVPLNLPGGGTLAPLPTRDAVLPIIAVLCASLEGGKGLPAVLDALPRRSGASGVVRAFPSSIAQEILRWLAPGDPSVLEAAFDSAGITLRTAEGTERAVSAEDPLREGLDAVRSRVERSFDAESGFAEIAWINWLDGVRVGFANNDVAHIRPSGNAPEMRIYAVADSPERAERIVELAVADDGILRRMEHDATERIAITGYRQSPRAVPVSGCVQHYEWGGYDFIPGLLGIENTERRPFAELWIGTHPKGPSFADLDGTRIPLDRLVAADPWLTLGPEVALNFAGRLPYLLKVLDVRIMASLQAHPSKKQAEEGFARENNAGIALSDPRRNYKDENHKPEAHVVLTDFWMLHGFRPLEEISEMLAMDTELRAMMPSYDERLRGVGKDPEARSALLHDLYARVMTMAQGEVDAMVEPLVARLEAEEARDELKRETHGFWALRAARTFPLPDGHRDRGIASMYLLNLVRLKPGQGTYQPAGTLHSYLEGVDVEVMANSDNVLRGGLTPKHVDVPELLATLTFRDGRPQILEGRAASETGREYETPAAEFALERIEIVPGTPYSAGRGHSADCIILVEGAAAVVAGGRTLTLSRGGSVMLPAALSYSIAARSPRAVLFKAGVPAAQGD